GALVFTLRRHGGAVVSLAYSPDSQQLLSAAEDGVAIIWHASIGEEFHVLRPGIPLACVAWSRDGRLLVLGSRDRVKDQGEVKFWDTKTRRELPVSIKCPAPVAGLAFQPEGRQLATACRDGTVRVWDSGNADEVLTLAGHTGEVAALAYSPDGRRLVSASHDKTLKLWDTGTGREVVTLRGHTGEVTTVAFGPKGDRLASGSTDQTVRLWDATPLPSAAPRARSDGGSS